MDREFFYDFIAGWFGGCAGLIAGHPLDTVKVRQQIMGKMSIWSCLKNTVKHEGFRGFYKGLGFPLLATGSLNSLFFGVYGNSLRALSADKDRPTYSDVFWAGCAGGAAQLLLACPVDLVKIQMQMQTGSLSWMTIVPLDVLKSRIQADDPLNPEYKGMMDCARKSYQREGASVFIRGFVMVSLRAIPTNGAIFLGYVTSLNMLRDTFTKPPENTL